MASWQSTPKSRYTEPASSAPSFKATNLGPCKPVRKRNSMYSTCAVFVAFCASPGRAKSLTTVSWRELESPACTHCWSRDACASWGMWYAWIMAGSPRISSMVSWHKANARLADPNCDTKTSARGTEGHGCRPHHMGSCSLRSGCLAADCAERPLQLRTVTHAAGWGKASETRQNDR